MSEHVSSLSDSLWRRFGTAIILGFLTAVAPLSIDMYLPALPALAKDLHATTSMAQLSLTACLVGLAIGQLLSGPISDAKGRRAPLLIGTAIYTLSSVLCAVTNSIYILIALRLIQGFAGSAGIVIARAMVRDFFKGHEMTKFFALLMLVNGVAPIAAPILGAQILRITSWHGVFIVLGALGCLMFCSVLVALPESLPVNERHRGGIRATTATIGRVIRDVEFVGYALTMGLVFAGMFAYISGSPFVLQGIFGLSAQMFSVVFASNGLGIILAAQISGRIAGRIGERKMLNVGLAIAGIASVCLLIAIVTHAPLFAVLPPLFFVVSTVGIVGTTATSLAMQEQGSRAGSASALIGVPQMLIGALVAPLAGIMGNHADLPLGVLIVLCEAGAIACYLGLVGRVRK